MLECITIGWYTEVLILVYYKFIFLYTYYILFIFSRGIT